MLIFIYNILLYILIPFIIPIGYIFAYKRGEEKDYFERFGFIKVDKDLSNTLWFHCASIGEVRSIKALVNIIKEEFKNVNIIVSTTTATGKRIAQEELKPDFAFLLPIENPLAISHLIEITDTKIFFIVDTEIWPNLISTVSKKVPLFLINGRLSDNSLKRYRQFRFIFNKLFDKFTKIYTKSDEDTKRFLSILNNTTKIVTLGNIKFYLASIPNDLNIIPDGKRLFVAGSTHRGEEEIILKSYLATINDDIFDQLIIAPRHLNRVNEVENLCIKFGLKVARLEKYDPEADVVLIDKFGILEYLYWKAVKVFVGGSLVEVGGHNIFEALQFKKAVAVGPNMNNFRDIFHWSLQYGIITVVNNENDLIKFMKSDIKQGDFDQFFSFLDQKNRELINPILKEIKNVFN